MWVDDPHFNARYHVRHTALPQPAGEHELRRLAGRVFAQRLDRSKPLWELWLVDRVGPDRFAMVAKTHHCLVDGVSGVDVTTVLFDLDPAPPEPPIARALGAAARADARARCSPKRSPSAPAGRWGSRARPPSAVAPRARRSPRAARRSAGSAAMTQAGPGRSAALAAERQIGPHRRFAWVDGDSRRSRRSRTRSAEPSTTSCSPS